MDRDIIIHGIARQRKANLSIAQHSRTVLFKVLSKFRWTGKDNKSKLDTWVFWWLVSSQYVWGLSTITYVVEDHREKILNVSFFISSPEILMTTLLFRVCALELGY